MHYQKHDGMAAARRDVRIYTRTHMHAHMNAHTHTHMHAHRRCDASISMHAHSPHPPTHTYTLKNIRGREGSTIKYSHGHNVNPLKGDRRLPVFVNFATAPLRHSALCRPCFEDRLDQSF